MLTALIFLTELVHTVLIFLPELVLAPLIFLSELVLTAMLFQAGFVDVMSAKDGDERFAVRRFFAMEGHSWWGVEN
jgi:hypothetical protein